MSEQTKRVEMMKFDMNSFFESLDKIFLYLFLKVIMIVDDDDVIKNLCSYLYKILDIFVCL